MTSIEWEEKMVELYPLIGHVRAYSSVTLKQLRGSRSPILCTGGDTPPPEAGPSQRKLNLTCVLRSFI